MLLRFGAANHLSLRTRQELSLVASTLKGNEAGLIDCPRISERALPVAVIYGANASGKSNVVGAFRFLLSAVRESHNNWAPDAGVPRHPFALDPACSRSHSFFDVDFVLEGVRYHYGFDATEKEFAAEWFDAYPAGRRQVLFRRAGQEFEFGRGLKGRNKIISDLTRPNSLFLSAARQNDHEELTKLSKFLARSDVHTADFWDVQARSQVPDEYMSKIVAFLNEIGTGVVGYRYNETSLPDDAQELIAAIYSTLEKRRPEGASPLPTDFRSHTSLELSHKAVNGEVIYFDCARRPEFVSGVRIPVSRYYTLRTSRNPTGGMPYKVGFGRFGLNITRRKERWRNFPISYQTLRLRSKEQRRSWDGGLWRVHPMVHHQRLSSFSRERYAAPNRSV